MKKNFNITNLVAVSLDGTSNNMSRTHGGVQALLLQISPGLLFVHCRSHVLQMKLASVKAASAVPVIKLTLNMLNKLYTGFHGSSKRLLMLKETQPALDGVNHKLVQPGETICCHYASISLSAKAVIAVSSRCRHARLLLILTYSFS